MNEMKKILLIGTGGTIASDVTDSGLAPELTTEQLLSPYSQDLGHLRRGLPPAAEPGQHQHDPGSLAGDRRLYPGALRLL